MKAFSFLTLSLFLITACSNELESHRGDRDLGSGIEGIKTGECFFYDRADAARYVKIADLPCLKKALEDGLNPDSIVTGFGQRENVTYLELALSDSSLFFAGAGGSNYHRTTALLLEYGANINASANGTTIIEKAMRVESEHQDIAIYLINFKPTKANQKALDPNQVSNGGTPLEIAIAVKNDKFVATLLENGADPEKHVSTEPPLIQALKSGQAVMANLLIDAGVSVEVKDDQRNTALMLAMSYDTQMAFDKILAKTIGVDELNANQATALLIASSLNDKRYFDKLLPRAKSLDAVDESRRSAIYFMVKSSDLSRVQALVKRQARMDIVSIHADSLLHVASTLQMTEYLLQNSKFDMDLINGAKKSPLALAVESKNLDTARLLVKNGADYSFRFANNDTLLHAAISGGDEAMAIFLIDLGIDVSLIGSAKKSALAIAVETKDLRSARLLVNAGADKSFRFAGRNTLVHEAVKNRDEPMVRYLLGLNLSANLLNDDKESALALAVEAGDLNIARALVEYKANVDFQYVDNEYLLHKVIVNRDVEMLRLLVSRGAEVNNPNRGALGFLALAVRMKDLSLAKILVEGGADLAYRSLDDDSLLHLAVRANSDELVRYLIGLGLDVNTKNFELETPAFSLGSILVAETLDRAGADFLVTGSSGKHVLSVLLEAGLPDLTLTKFLIKKGMKPEQDVALHVFPLELVVKNRGNLPFSYLAEMISTLVDAGADINLRGSQGASILHSLKSPEWVKFLFTKGANLSSPNAQGKTLLVETLATIPEVEAKIKALGRIENGKSPRLQALRIQLANLGEVREFLIEKGAQ